MKIVRPYGTWSSPLGADIVASGSIQLEAIAVENGALYWIERRPDEAGRHVVVSRAPDGKIQDLTPPGTNVRTRVHEYGGGACLVANGTLYYSNFSDQRLWRLDPGHQPVALTPAGPWRFADATFDSRRKRLICVREEHDVPDAGGSPPGAPRNTLVSIPIDGPTTAGDVIAEGDDFYSTPRVNPDGTQLTWLSWRHPQMPWEGTTLHVARIGADGLLAEVESVAGGPAESIVQPGWSPDGGLYFVSDRSGWWNLYRVREGRTEPLLPMDAEFAGPAWTFGNSTWAFLDATHMVVTFGRSGSWHLATLDIASRTLTLVDAVPEPGNVLLADNGRAVYVGRSRREPDALVEVALERTRVHVVRAASPLLLDHGFISEPRQIVFPTDDGEEARLFYYAPCNAVVEAPHRELPPLIVVIHGGPTAAATTRLSLGTQFWTTRGFAVADVDHRGSSGYGRAYRRRLDGAWGIVDVADCVDAARHLVTLGLADPDRLIIRGGSAGGFTTLAALTFHAGVFEAGGCYYGIGDLEALAKHTHKFERHYTDGLIAPYPERADLYRERSPIHAVDHLSVPVIFFHGREDMVVPVEQAEMMAESIRAKGLRADLLIFDGEQHGFRQHETIARCLEAELRFYSEVFGFVS